MARSRRTWPTVGVLLLTALLTVLLIAAVIYMFTARDRGTTATVVGTLVTLGMASAAYFGWVSRRRQATAAPVEQALREAADSLAWSIDEQWKTAAGERHLYPAIPLRWQWSRHRVTGSPDDAIVYPRDERAPRRLPKAPIIRRPALNAGGRRDLLDIYLGLPSGRILLLGKSGAGKTAAAILLLRDALAERAKHDEEPRARVPVPVMFTVQDWNPRESIRLWLARRLTEDYGNVIGHDPDMAAQLVSQGYVSVILDGLDEMPAPARVVALQELNKVADLRMVIMSRAGKLEEIVDCAHLTCAAAPELQPVSHRAAAGYLRSRLPDPPSPAWHRLLGALEQDGGTPLARALGTPLMISLLFDTYYPQSDRGPDELPDITRFPSQRAVENHLLGRLVPVAYSADRHPGQARPRYTEEQASRWLRYIATRLDQTHEGGTQSLEWWKIPAWRPAWPRAVANLVVVALAVGVGLDLPDGLDAGLTIAFFRGPARGLHTGLHTALTAGLPSTANAANVMTNVLAVLVIVWLGLRRTGRTPKRLGKLNWRQAISPWPISFGLCFGLLVGVGIGQSSANGHSAHGDGAGAIFNIGYGVAAGIAAMLVAALVNGLVARDQSPRRSQISPADWWRGERRYGLAIGLLAGPATGIGDGFFVYRDLGYTTVGLLSMLISILVWTVIGAVLGLTYTQPWHARLAAAQLFLRGRCPLDLLRFLQDAVDRQVLRTAGGSYQFRHATVQELLAVAHADVQAADPGLARRLRAWLQPPPYASD
jgi:hypothetical protein